MFPAHLATREALDKYNAQQDAKEQQLREEESAAQSAAEAAAPKHHVVVLEGCHCAIPKFNFPYTYKEYDNTFPAQVAERIKNATIVVATICPVLPDDMDQAPNLQCIGIMATGIGWLDKEYCAKRGITVVNTPQSNIPAVSEHCIGLYFAVRKRIVEMHNLTTTTDEWAEKGTLTKRFEPLGAPLSAEQEVMGIIGYGHLGKRIEMLAKALGFSEVLIAERKRAPLRKGRKVFQEVVSKCTVLVIACPRDEMTVGLIGKEDLRSMRKDAILINMARGGIVDEQALADALRNGWIAGAATDVLDVEPGVLGESPLLPKKGEEPVPNFTISPHISWFSVMTIESLQVLLKGGVEGWYKGSPPEASTVVHDGKVYR